MNLVIYLWYSSDINPHLRRHMLDQDNPICPTLRQPCDMEISSSQDCFQYIKQEITNQVYLKIVKKKYKVVPSINNIVNMTQPIR